MPQASPRVRIERQERQGGALVVRLVIDHERKLNTLGRALMLELAASFAALVDEEALRAVVLTGAGDKAFIGGADIDEMAALDEATAEGFITLLHRVCAAIRTLRAPVIARINGLALGAGVEIAAACDLRVACEEARFGMPEVKLGIPSVIEAALLPGLIGWGRTREILLTGETYPAAEAARWGFVERVVPYDRLDEAVEAWVGSLLAAGPRAVRLQKKLIRTWEDLPLREAIATGIDAFAEAYRSDEPRRMMAEFQARRAARRRAKR